MANQIEDQTIQKIADAIQNVADEIDNAFRYNPPVGDHNYTVADSLESIALSFDRWVNLQEKIYEDKK